MQRFPVPACIHRNNTKFLSVFYPCTVEECSIVCYDDFVYRIQKKKVRSQETDRENEVRT